MVLKISYQFEKFKLILKNSNQTLNLNHNIIILYTLMLSNRILCQSIDNLLLLLLLLLLLMVMVRHPVQYMQRMKMSLRQTKIKLKLA